MSLTRNQWIEMWASIKLIEALSHELANSQFEHVPRRTIRSKMNQNLIEIQKIKDAIQDVIGQME